MKARRRTSCAGLPLDQSGPPLPAEAIRRTGIEPTVTVSGWKVYDNQGRLVEGYEPFFDRGWSYRSRTAGQRGESTRTHYDPRGQVVRAVYPDGPEQRVVHGVPFDLAKPDRFRPTPWEIYTYDQTTTPAARTSIRAGPTKGTGILRRARSATLSGAPVRATERLGPKPAGEWFVTRTRCDIRGNAPAVARPGGRPQRHGNGDVTAASTMRSSPREPNTLLALAARPLDGQA